MEDKNNISASLKERLLSKLQYVLSNEFNGEKSRIKQGYDRINFACPYCGDSSENHYKKRGNIYWKSLMFHCYNCSKHTSIINLLKDFNNSLNTVEDVTNVLDYIAENRIDTKPIEYLQIGVFKGLSDLAIDRSELIKLLNLEEIKLGTVAYTFVKNKFLLNRHKHFAWSNKKKQLYVFNLTRDNKVIGYQVRNFDTNRAKYVSFTIEKIYNEIKRELPKFDGMEKINTLSLYYNIMIVDLTKTFTIFEGPSDALLYPRQSIALSGVSKNSEMFDEIPGARYLFDNDAIGRRTMEGKLKRKKNVFMWRKFIKEHKLDRGIKDFNDLIKYCYFDKNSAYKNIDKYFTTSPYDILNI